MNYLFAFHFKCVHIYIRCSRKSNTYFVCILSWSFCVHMCFKRGPHSVYKVHIHMCIYVYISCPYASIRIHDHLCMEQLGPHLSSSPREDTLFVAISYMFRVKPKVFVPSSPKLACIFGCRRIEFPEAILYGKCNIVLKLFGAISNNCENN